MLKRQCVTASWVAAMLVVVAATTPAVRGSQAAPVLVGRVVDAVSGVPVQDAVVTVSAMPLVTAEVGPDGRFDVALPSTSGPWRVVGVAPGYLPGRPGQRGPTDDAMSAPGVAAADLRAGGVVIRLWREATVGGVVTDELGLPVVGAAVSILADAPTGVVLPRAVTMPMRTDDQGRFFTDQLVPGDYRIGVRPIVDPRVGADAPGIVTFHPGTAVMAEAALVRLVAGAHAVADIRIDFGSAVGSVRGRLGGLDAFANARVILVPQDLAATVRDVSGPSLASGRVVGTVEGRVGTDGHFTVRGLARGPYRLLARATAAAASGELWCASVPLVVVSDEPLDVVVPLAPAARIRGRVTTPDGRAPVPEPGTSLVVAFAPIGESFGPVRPVPLEGDGTFASAPLPPGGYLIGFGRSASTGSRWTVASIQAQGREVVAAPIDLGATDVEAELTVIDRPTVVAGEVRDRGGRIVGDARLIVFPMDRASRDQLFPFPAQRRVVMATGDLSGAFRVEVPPGEYLVAAIPGDLPLRWTSPVYLASLEGRAVPATVTSGQATTVVVIQR